MKRLAPLPLVMASIVMAAHFSRSGDHGLVFLVMVAPLLVTTRDLLAIRTVQVLLVVGAAEWVRTVWAIAQHRAAFGAPFTRMLVILGLVGLFTRPRSGSRRWRDARSDDRSSPPAEENG